MRKGTTIYLLLGGNLGDKIAVQNEAAQLISERIGAVLQRSSVYESEPWGFDNAPTFINQVLKIESNATPHEILEQTQRIEKELGRVRNDAPGYSSRLIDIDLLFYGDVVVDTVDLQVPHPQIQNRRFTLLPMAEVAAQFVHPALSQTMEALLEGCPDDSIVKIIDACATIS